MKKFFIMLAAAATVVSCANEETISRVEGEAIGFNSFVENATRAAVDPSLGTNANPFNTFNVWGTVGGVAIFSGNSVTKGNNDIWTCGDVKQYWIKDAQYKFAAVAGVAKTAVTAGDDKLPAKVVVDATSAAVDLLYAPSVSMTGKASNNPEVPFIFSHLLSKVKFTVINNSTAAANYSFNVRDIVVKGSKTGTIKLSDKSWEDKSTADNYTVPTITVNATTASAECANELLLIPGNIDITFVVDILCEGTPIATHEYNTTPYTRSIDGGCAYNFKIEVSVGEEIKFTVDEYIDWDGDDTTDGIQDGYNDTTLL